MPRKFIIPTHVCERCGAPFTAPNWHKRKYCSKRCVYAAKAQAVNDRFLSRLDRVGECRVWAGKLDAHGYGMVKRQGKWIRAHRFAFALAHGPIPDGLFVCHRCDVRACCNPDHLFLGTALDNIRDMMAKGRARFGFSTRGERFGEWGETHHSAKLTAAAVVAIRAAATTGVSFAELARQHGVTEGTIRFACHRRTWKHVA